MTTTGTSPAAAQDLVDYDIADGVAQIRLNRPEASNALDLPMSFALRDALLRAATDDVGAVLLTGAGRLFCAGGDLGAMHAAPDRRAFIEQLAHAAHEAVIALDELSTPVVAAVQGAAAGIGFSLVLGADLVVAGESARFVTAYTSVGLTPDGGLSWRLPRTVGQRLASQLILTSEPVDAQRALAVGIASHVCPDEEVAETAHALAIQLAARPRHALGAARRLVRASWSNDLRDHLQLEAATVADAAATDETGARITAFLNRT